MRIALRIGREIAAQAAAFVAAFFDRAILAAILLRLWGVESFAIWSLAVSAAGLTAFFTFGLNLYFSNRITFSVIRGRSHVAIHAYRAGNLLMAVAAIVAVVVVLAGTLVWQYRLDHQMADGTLLAVTAMLTLAAATKMALSAQYSLYRAHNEFVRQSLWLSSSVILPAGLAGLAALIGEGVAVAALAYLAGTLATTIPILYDGRRRFAGFRFGFALPNKVERRTAPLLSFAFWLQSAPSALIASGPILLLGLFGAGAVTISRFILIRTVVNLARTVLQLAGVVIGQEGARRVAARDQAGLLGVFQEGTYFLGVATAAGSGILLALGEPIFRLWTGSADLFSQSLFWIGLAPTAIVPVFTVAENVLSSSNRPWPLVAGRLAQLALTILLLVALPIDRLDLRLMAALSIGEVVGFGLPVCIASTRLATGLAAGFFAKSILFAVIAAALSYAATAGIYEALGGSLEGLILALAGGGCVALSCVAIMGLTRSRRTALRAWLAGPRAGRGIAAPAATPNNQ